MRFRRQSVARRGAGAAVYTTLPSPHSTHTHTHKMSRHSTSQTNAESFIDFALCSFTTNICLLTFIFFVYHTINSFIARKYYMIYCYWRESVAGAHELRVSNIPTSACNANQWRTDVARRDDSHEHNCSDSHLNKILCVEPNGGGGVQCN